METIAIILAALLLKPLKTTYSRITHFELRVCGDEDGGRYLRRADSIAVVFGHSLSWICGVYKLHDFNVTVIMSMPISIRFQTGKLETKSLDFNFAQSMSTGKSTINGGGGGKSEDSEGEHIVAGKDRKDPPVMMTEIPLNQYYYRPI